MDNFVFKNPTKIFFGKGSLDYLGDEIVQYGKRILVTSGGGSVKRIGLYDRVMDILKSRGLDVFELSGIEPNPKYTSVLKGVEICRREDIDFILAIGGGSCIDGSKGIAAGARVDGDIWERFLDPSDITDAIPVGTILTLPATGSEMNGNAVISRWDTNEKVPIYGPAIYPAFSILDPTNTFSVPLNHTVYGNIDIIIHSLEQYFTHTPETPILDYLTEGLVRTVIDNTYRILKNPEDYDARANVMFAGTVANNHWIGVGKVHDWASHKIEHELSALYDISHGAGLAVIYPNWMKYAMQQDPSRFVRFAEKVFDIDPIGKTDMEIAEAGAEKMREFFNSVGAPSTLADVGVDPEKIPYMAEQAVRFGPLGGYRILGKEDVEAILRMCI